MRPSGVESGADAGRIDALIQRANRLGEARRPWEAHWRELADAFLPSVAPGFGAGGNPGGRRGELYDSVPLQARRGLAAALDALLKPKTAQWFHLRAVDEDLNENDGVRAWTGAVEARLFRALYQPGARFVAQSAAVDNDLVTFGTGVLFIGESARLDRLAFRAVPLKDVLIAENGDGQVDTVFLWIDLTARQAAQRWGADALGAPTREALGSDDPDQRFRFLHAITPRPEADPARLDAPAMPFASIVIDVGAHHLVGEGGFREFPFAVPRWDLASGEVYGRSPAMLALADAKTLQQMGKTLLVAGQKAVDPPMWALDDAVIGTPRTFPGGITVLDADGARDLGGRPPFGTLETGRNFPLGRELQNATREQVWAAFFRNVLQLPTSGPSMTATEVIERREDFLRTIGPVFGQL